MTFAIVYTVFALAVFIFFAWAGLTGPARAEMTRAGIDAPTIVACSAICGFFWWATIPWLLLRMWTLHKRTRRLNAATATLDLLAEKYGAHPAVAKARHEAGLRPANQA